MHVSIFARILACPGEQAICAAPRCGANDCRLEAFQLAQSDLQHRPAMPYIIGPAGIGALNLLGKQFVGIQAAGMLGDRVPDVVEFNPSWHHNYCSIGFWQAEAPAASGRNWATMRGRVNKISHQTAMPSGAP